MAGGRTTRGGSGINRDAPRDAPPDDSTSQRSSLEDECDRLLQTVPEDQRTILKIFSKLVRVQLQAELQQLRTELTGKDEEIRDLVSEVSDLKQKVKVLETHIDDVDQYERRDTIIINGPALPNETALENARNVAISTFKDKLKININASDISVAHRLGKNATQTRKRPIILKLVNRSLKNDLINACIHLKPQLYINESLTPKRSAIMKKILYVRREHKAKFQQCYTHDGKIIIKLRNSTIKHVITDEVSLSQFLGKYPDMEVTCREYSNTPHPNTV